MNSLDLLILSIAAFAATWGAMRGAARQIAQLLSVVAAYPAALFLGPLLGPSIGKALGSSPGIGRVAATMIAFIAVVVILRFALTQLLRQAISGGDPRDRSVDRMLGFVLGGAKVLLFAYVILCCLAFVEENVAIKGQRLGFTPKGSMLFSFAKKYNVIESTQFASLKELAVVAQVAADPKQAQKLKGDPAFQALAKDPRFKALMESPQLKKAIAAGDYHALLRSEAVAQLLADPEAVKKLTAVAESVP